MQQTVYEKDNSVSLYRCFGCGENDYELMDRYDISGKMLYKDNRIFFLGKDQKTIFNIDTSKKKLKKERFLASKSKIRFFNVSEGWGDSYICYVTKGKLNVKLFYEDYKKTFKLDAEKIQASNLEGMYCCNEYIYLYDNKKLNTFFYNIYEERRII